jgi:hypothetical protein
MSGTSALFAALHQAADPQVVGRIEHLVEHGSDRSLNRIPLGAQPPGQL